MGNFYSRLSYSFGNEDWNTEQKALQIKPDDRVLCVTASGDRPLNLLTRELKEIVAIDANPLQNALFDLKKTALSKLSYSDYIAFIGCAPSTNRLKTYSILSKDLDPMAHALWELLPKKISRGVIYQGSVEKLLKFACSWIRFFRRKKIEELFAIDNLKEQKLYIHSHWHTFLWKKAFQVMLHPRFTRYFKDPGLYENVDPNIHVGEQLYERLHGYMEHNLVKESILLTMIFKGKIEPKYFPPYLSEEGVAKIKKQVHKAHFFTDDLISYVTKAEEESFDCFSISDVASYLSKAQFDELVEGMFKCAKPGARFCMRQLLSNHEIPAHLSKYFIRNSALEKQLQKEDSCCVYKFMAGAIKK